MESFVKNLEVIRVLIEDPYNHVYDITQKALRQTSLNREESLKEIEESSLKKFDEVEAFRVECYKKIESNDFRHLFSNHRESFESLKSLLENPNCVEPKLNLLNSRCRNLIDSMKEILLNGKSLNLYPGFVPQTSEVKIENM
jgi:hypothetical protein